MVHCDERMGFTNARPWHLGIASWSLTIGKPITQRNRLVRKSLSPRTICSKDKRKILQGGFFYINPASVDIQPFYGLLFAVRSKD